MLLNRVEYALMNNPLRAALQRHFEAARLLRMGGPMQGGTALEIGCGRGVGAELILDVFGAVASMPSTWIRAWWRWHAGASSRKALARGCGSETLRRSR
jgi:hypothetical protein